MTTIKTIRVVCDIKECDKEAFKVNLTIPVKFMTEQTEGRSTDPHISEETLDLCEDHYQTYFNSLSITGYGAQGNNSYYLKD